MPATPSPIKLSVIVPCYNEESGLTEFHRRLTNACEDCQTVSYEIIYINDGSKDSTGTLLAALARQDPHVVAIDLSRNYGHQLALSAGLAHATGDRAFILDADLQDPPEHLTAMMRLMDEGASVIYGQRLTRRKDGWFKRLTSFLFYRILARSVDIQIPLDTGDFRLINRTVIDLLNQMPERSRFMRGMISWIGLRQIPFPYERQPRAAGETHYPLPRMIRLAIDALTSFSLIPLRLTTYLGLLLGVASLMMIGYTLYVWAHGETVHGWTSLMIVILVIGSAQLLSLGIIGEYLGRLYMESKQRPLYIIERITRSP